jgi:hypothetical protein
MRHPEGELCLRKADLPDLEPAGIGRIRELVAPLKRILDSPLPQHIPIRVEKFADYVSTGLAIAGLLQAAGADACLPECEI